MTKTQVYNENGAYEGEKNPPPLSLKADQKTFHASPDCRADMTLFHLFSFFFLKSAALSKSPPDFQLLSLAAAPDKQNLLDQADFTAAPAHMAASVAHSLS